MSVAAKTFDLRPVREAVMGTLHDLEDAQDLSVVIAPAGSDGLISIHHSTLPSLESSWVKTSDRL